MNNSYTTIEDLGFFKGRLKGLVIHYASDFLGKFNTPLILRLRGIIKFTALKDKLFSEDLFAKCNLVSSKFLLVC